MKYYVLGFLFDGCFEKVMLIKKTKPKWQHDRLNGVGGKIEKGETSLAAMCREWREETGTEFTDWKPFCAMKLPDAEIDCYAGRDHFNHIFYDVKATTDETPIAIAPRALHLYKRIRNLDWLVPMAQDYLSRLKQFETTVTYADTMSA